MKIFWPNMSLLVIVLTIACNKATVSTPVPTPTPAPVKVEELLTQKEWVLTSIGFDENKDGLIDATEEQITDCQKDNTIKFNTDGTGFSKDRGLPCNVASEADFNWILATDNMTLVINGNKILSLKIDKNEFMYTPEVQGIVGAYIITYRH